MAARCLKCVLGQIPRFTGTENGHPMEDLCWTLTYFAHWNALNRFSMHFNGLFHFVWRGFRLTVIWMEWIILIKPGTTAVNISCCSSWGFVLWMATSTVAAILCTVPLPRGGHFAGAPTIVTSSSQTQMPSPMQSSQEPLLFSTF